MTPQLKGPMDRMIYNWIRQGKPNTHRGKGDLQFGFRPNQLIISRKGETPPSPQEAITVYNSLRRAIQAATFAADIPAVDQSELTRWPKYEAVGYVFTWGDNNA